MTTGPTTSDVFAKRAELWNDTAPVFAAMCRTVAAQPELAAAVTAGPATTEHRPGSVWSRPHLLSAVVTRTLRDTAGAHDLAEYWSTLGGNREADENLPDTLREFCREYRDHLTACAAEHPSSRQNDPIIAAMFWPAIARAAAAIDGPVALLELGSAAGLCLYPDRFGYRYGDRTFRGDSRLVLECGFDGEPPRYLGADIDVVARIGLEYEPIRRSDPAAIAWLRDCVLPDNAGELGRIDRALSIVETDGVDWRTGDFMETLPKALAEVPAGATPIVYGAHTLCCVREASRLPAILADSGRDLVWIAKEHADNALGLVSDAAAEFATEDELHPPVLLTAVTYRGGSRTQAWVLGEPEPFNTSLTWAPRQIPTA